MPEAEAAAAAATSERSETVLLFVRSKWRPTWKVLPTPHLLVQVVVPSPVGDEAKVDEVDLLLHRLWHVLCVPKDFDAGAPADKGGRLDARVQAATREDASLVSGFL